MENIVELSKYTVMVISTLLAFIPIFLWGYHFLKKHKESRKMVIIAFIGGVISVIPLLLYKFSWNYFPWINAFVWTRSVNADVLGLSSFMLIPIPILLTFMFVGIIEEMSKITAVKFLGKRRFQSVDDAIELAIVVALGFAFVENSIYFYNIINSRGFEQLFFPFVFRSLFSTFAHVMFSGIFGYFYGVAHFAGPILKNEIRKNRHPLLSFFHKYFHFKRSVMFHDEKILEGLVIAVSLHAFFNILLEMEWTFLIIPFLVCGYVYLNYLLHQKDNLRKYKKLASVRINKS